MSLSIEQIDAYLRVTGYPDGSDWIFRPARRPDVGYGVAGPEHVWCCDRGGTLQIFHAPARRPTAMLEIGKMEGAAAPIASRDGRKLYARTLAGPSASSLTVIDVAAGEVTAVHGGLPWYRRDPVVERPDGRLLLSELGPGLILLDPATGDGQASRVPGAGNRDPFLGGSPDGRYWVRFDRTTLPKRVSEPTWKERVFGRQKVEPLYGLTLQIWEAFPLRLVRRVAVAWLTVEELPDETHLRTPSARRAIWDAIAAATATASDPGTPPPRSAYPPPFSTDDKRWTDVEQNFTWLARQWVRVAGWQPDGEAFWVSTNSFLSCVGVDGTVSPRLYTERLGLQGGTWLPVAAHWKEVAPLAGRKARVTYDSGTALFDGAPRATPSTTDAIPAGRDGWRPHAADGKAARDAQAARIRAAALEDERITIVVPLAGWTEAACVAAIEALTARVDAGDLHALATPGAPIRVVFALGGERVGESRFFSEVRARFPGALPAIRRLVERYVAVSEADPGSPYSGLHVNPDNYAELLAQAVQALGVLDRSALPTLERYGRLIDVEHQGAVFTRETVPAVIKAHGWTDDVVDFVFWVIVQHYYNSLQDYGVIWRDWGLRDAVARREPRALARRLMTVLADDIARKDDPGRYGSGSLDQLAAQIRQPHDPWAQAFFAELERVAVERFGEWA